MSTPTSTERPWWRRLIQFNLRTILVVVTVAAIVCAWVVNAREERVAMFGDALTVIRQTRGKTDDDIPIQSGRWIVQDKDGRTRVIGHMLNDVPHGSWTAYYGNGRKAWQGTCRKGAAIGTWREWNEDGTLRSKHRCVASVGPPPRLSSVYVGGFRRDSSLPFVVAPSDRHGPSITYWPDGTTQSEGSFQDNVAEGTWSFYTESGELAARGTIERGQRQGVWQVRDETTSALTEIRYVRGQRVDDMDAMLSRLSQSLERGELHEQIAAARELESLGKPAAELLRDKLLSTSDRDVQLLALRTLGRIGPPAAMALPAIEPFRTSSDRVLKRHALLAVYCIDASSHDAVRNELLTAIESTDRPPQRAETLRHLMSIDPTSADTFQLHLIRTAAVATPAIRREIVGEITHLDPIPFSLLNDCLDTKDIEVQKVVCEIAAEILGPFRYNWEDEDAARDAARELLKRAFDNPDPTLRRHIRTLDPKGWQHLFGHGMIPVVG